MRAESRCSGKQLTPAGKALSARRLEQAQLITNTFFTEYTRKGYERKGDDEK